MNISLYLQRYRFGDQLQGLVKRIGDGAAGPSANALGVLPTVLHSKNRLYGWTGSRL